MWPENHYWKLSKKETIVTPGPYSNWIESFLTQRRNLEPQQIQLMMEKYGSDLPQSFFLKMVSYYYRLGKAQVRFGNYNDAFDKFSKDPKS